MANYFFSPSGAGVAPVSGAGVAGVSVAGAALSAGGVTGAAFFSAQPRTETLKVAAKTKETNFFIRFS